jgi:hypothetical protein
MIRVFLLAALGMYTVFATGCSGAGDPPPGIAVEADSETKSAPAATELCQNHEDGCPCDNPGETTDCGRIKRVEGDYVWCSTGTQVCSEDGAWGKCSGDVIDTSPAPN